MKGRADIYIGFYEKGLLLEKEGNLGFISPDSWMRNDYGTALRELINEYSLDYLIDMHKTEPFEKDVNAYPAITVISKPKKKNKKGPFIAQAKEGFSGFAAKQLKIKCVQKTLLMPNLILLRN